MPLFERLEACVLSADRLHDDDTGCRFWRQRQDRHWPDLGLREGQSRLYYTGIFQADACDGYGKLYQPGRTPGSILAAACWVHALGSCPASVLRDGGSGRERPSLGKRPAAISPMTLEAVRRIDELIEIERAINGQSPERRRAIRQELTAPLVARMRE
jgi:transposase